MIPPLTPEQREYKELTLGQLMANQAQLEARLAQETEPRLVKSIQRQLADIEAHINRLQDELSGSVIMDEPVAEELFKKSTGALAKGKFHLARRYIAKLETIEPFYPGLDRLKHETETQQVSRRTRSIAAGTASGYSATALALPNRPAAGPGAEALPAPATPVTYEEPQSWTSQLFQFHYIASCLAILVILCAVLGVFGVTILQWLVEGGT